MRLSCGPLSPFYFLSVVVAVSLDVAANPGNSEQVMAFAFEKLIVYQKSVDFADKVTEQTGQFPRGYYFLADQLNRASLSICTHRYLGFRLLLCFLPT